MKVILYIAETGTFMDKLINVWTGLYGYSHCEIVFDKMPQKNGKYLCCSSSPRDLKVRFNYIDIKSKHWHIVDIPSNSKIDDEVYKEMKKLEGAKYDWKGIFLTFIFSWVDKQDNKKWWCSEIVAHILNKFYIPMKLRVHPNRLAKTLKAPRQPFKFTLGMKKRY